MLSAILAITSIEDLASHHVLVVCNAANRDSIAVAEYYASRRRLSADQVLRVDVSQSETIGQDEYQDYVELPVKRAIRRANFRVDFIVTCKGIPLQIGPSGDRGNFRGISLDSVLGQMDRNVKPISDKDDISQVAQALNPYFDSKEHFSSSKYSMFLVTRLDGVTVEDCYSLIEQSLSAKPVMAPFFFDLEPDKDESGFASIQDRMRTASSLLIHKGLDSEIDQSPAFVTPKSPVSSYMSWGSKDLKYDRTALLNVRYIPGAIGELVCGNSAATFRGVETPESQITDMIRTGITGVKGYIGEPYTIGLTRPDILFDHYTSGYNLAESFFAATPLVKWKDVVVGDPLCNPYKGN